MNLKRREIIPVIIPIFPVIISIFPVIVMSVCTPCCSWLFPVRWCM